MGRYLDGMMGMVAGDALGVPVEFTSQEERTQDPVTGMREYGTYLQPAGTWSDDSSMALAALASLSCGQLDFDDVMRRFEAWLREGEYTPDGDTFDVGNTCYRAVLAYARDGDWRTCGQSGEKDNGNGSLMRIMPFCLYAYERQQEGMSDREALALIHDASALTHAHDRSKIACGLYYFMVRAVLDGKGRPLSGLLQEGIDEGFAFYRENPELAHYGKVKDLKALQDMPRGSISGSGYVVRTMEAVLWSLMNGKDYRETALLSVNLGDDTDTVAAIAGGLAGLYYGYEDIPAEWLSVIRKREWIEELCGKME